MIIDFHVHIWEQEMLSPGYKEYLNNFTEITRTNNNEYRADPNRLIEDMDEAETPAWQRQEYTPPSCML